MAGVYQAALIEAEEAKLREREQHLASQGVSSVN
jgi:hypothetical protein